MRTIALVVSVAVLSTACTSDDSEPKRPPISRYLDASTYLDRPCDLLPKEQAERFGYTVPGYPSKTSASAVGKESPYSSCSRFPPESASLDIKLSRAEDWLAREYYYSKTPGFIGDTHEPWMEPLTIAGQPAVTLGRSHKRPNRTCRVIVGLTDTQSLDVSTSEQDSDGGRINGGLGQGDGKACEYAIGVAEAIVKTLGG